MSSKENRALISEIDFPAETKINGKESGSYYRDSFSVTVMKDDLEPAYVYHSIFGYLPIVAQWALEFRNSIVKWFGFSASNSQMSLPLEDIQEGKKAGFLTVELVSGSEIVCGAYDKNMDMWLSVLKLSDSEYAISTLVNLKTKSGRVYMTVFKPFHKLVAKFTIKQALKAGRI